jgi:transcriptional regulator with XRE-family HTH domain
MTLINTTAINTGKKMTAHETLKKTSARGLKKTITRDHLKTVGLRVCAIRKNYTLTQQQMADRLLISRNYLSEIENGRKVPKGLLLAALGSIFLVNIQWILNGSGEMLTNNTVEASNAEHEDIVMLLKGFRSMSDEGRKKLMNILKIFMLVEDNMPDNS